MLGDTAGMTPVQRRLDEASVDPDISVTLERIATALETLAADVAERRQRERQALLARWSALQRRAEEAGRLFSVADRAIVRGHATPAEVATAQRWEEEMFVAAAALREFEEANPEIVEIVAQLEQAGIHAVQGASTGGAS